MSEGLRFNPPPGWPTPPDGWVPPSGWAPDPAWPDPPAGWQLWISGEGDGDDPEAPVPPAVENSEESDDLTTQLAILKSENEALRAQIASAGQTLDEVVVLDDEQVLQSVGIYRYHHPLENAAAFKERLSDLSGEIATLVKAGGAIEASNMFTFDNSLAKGRKMVADLSKLMLRGVQRRGRQQHSFPSCRKRRDRQEAPRSLTDFDRQARPNDGDAYLRCVP